MVGIHLLLSLFRVCIPPAVTLRRLANENVVVVGRSGGGCSGSGSCVVKR